MASFSCGNSSTSKAIRKGGKAILHGNSVGGYCTALSSYLLSAPASSNSEKKYVAQMIDALFEDNVKLLQKTLKKNVDVNLLIRFVEDGEKMTALHFTALKGKVQMLEELLKSKMCKIDLKTPVDESTALHFACRHSDCRVSKTLVDCLLLWGADINLGDHWEKSPLIWATELGHFEVVQLLLHNGASVDHCYQIADTPETPGCHCPIALLLIRDPFYGNNALMQACRYNHTNLIHELLKYGPKINVQNRNGSTALHVVCGGYAGEDGSGIATSVPDPDIAELLVANGAELNIQDNLGMTPIVRTVLSLEKLIKYRTLSERVFDILDVIRILKLLIKSGCDVYSPYPCMCPKKEVTVLKKLLFLIESIVSITTTDTLRLPFEHVLEMLILAGSSIDKEDVEYALKFGSPRLVTCFIDHYHTPLTLKSCCIRKLRQQTKPPLQPNLQSLDLPDVLKKMVCLEI